MRNGLRAREAGAQPGLNNIMTPLDIDDLVSALPDDLGGSQNSAHAVQAGAVDRMERIPGCP